MSLNHHEKIKMFSDLAYSLCKKFGMNPYVVFLFPRRNVIFIQGDEYSKSIEEKLIENKFKFVGYFTDDSNRAIFKDYETNLNGIRITFTLVSRKAITYQELHEKNNIEK